MMRISRISIPGSDNHLLYNNLDINILIIEISFLFQKNINIEAWTNTHISTKIKLVLLVLNKFRTRSMDIAYIICSKNTSIRLKMQRSSTKKSKKRPSTGSGADQAQQQRARPGPSMQACGPGARSAPHGPCTIRFTQSTHVSRMVRSGPHARMQASTHVAHCDGCSSRTGLHGSVLVQSTTVEAQFKAGSGVFWAGL